MTGAFLSIFGILLILSPAIHFMMNRKDGDENEVEMWIFSLPLDKIFLIQGMVISGFLFMMAGVAI